MKRSFLFVVLFCIFCIKNGNLKQDYFTGFLIRTTLNSALDYLKRIGYIEIIREISLTTPTILNDVIMEKFQLKNLSLYGLSTLNYRDTVVVDDLLDNNVTVKTIILKLNASLDTLGVGADYDVSMKFLSILPLRIKSRIRFGSLLIVYNI
ncbi:uncharacterized protein LOC130891453 [Diorhabda carinulata]|uniref:uncharacterized protein LOC130891453 n=1 Tax=Diorhabda carinulata TaxID=1163345 RepID=UPI0025A05A4E|nr:uncharacterized protein LOC130891453 [Diorhabda carinulata]